ncbi:MAG TPA: helix-turn-helix transcriptional regulator, partial [Solirubrobacteraceae bacterium]|nr:helix-turn-helix transcriptional regulator [Solirubrobacteraceae bacterium]
GRRDEAARVARRFQESAEAKGQPWALARAARTVGMLGTDAELDTHFPVALEQHAHTLDVFETARTRLVFGARLRRARRRVDARPQLRDALATFERLGAVRWADLAAGELSATGESIRRREPSTVATLTPQELQVALLLGEGRTTREVAAALFLSPKTVEYHLRKVYTKLDIRSRAELAEQLSGLAPRQ